MAKLELHDRAIEMRKLGMSYSQIRDELKVSKSTLSLWLQQYPLSEERICELRDKNPRRIERYRETRRRTRETRLLAVRERASQYLADFSEREILIGGLFLYWGEGGKTKPCTTTVSNTDPTMLAFFMRWLEILGVSRDKLRVHIHLYADMNVQAEIQYWSETLGLPETAFRKPYIKKSNRSGLSYKQKFTHGTCNLIYDNRDITEYVLQALEVIRSRFAPRVSL